MKNFKTRSLRYMVQNKGYLWSNKQKKWVNLESSEASSSTAVFLSKRKAYNCFMGCPKGSVMQITMIKMHKRYIREIVKN